MFPNLARGAAGRNLPRLARPLAMLAAAAFLAAPAALAVAAPAVAAGQDVPGSQIAASLRQDPVWVDPSLASAFPQSARGELLAAIGKAPVPVYVVAVPFVSGSQWSTPEQLADVVQNALGRPGIYLTLDSAEPDGVDAYTWPSDPQSLDAPPYHASDAAQAASLQTPYGAPVWQVFLRAIQLVDNGHGESALNAALASPPGGSGGQPGSSSSGGDAAVGGVILAALVALPVIGTVLWVRRSRRRRRVPAASTAISESPAFTPPGTVIAAARAASAADLRARAQKELLELAEVLEEPAPEGSAGAGAPPSGEADADTARGLDAYEAAAHALDSATGIPDLAGVLVLTQAGRCAAAAAQADQAGQDPPDPVQLCFFNPLHGTAPGRAPWRARGGPEVLDVAACRACANAVMQRKFPDVLRADDGKPYYEQPGSVWAATGYGQFSSTDDLIRRILAPQAPPARR
jgi:hypothetical protein